MDGAIGLVGDAGAFGNLLIVGGAACAVAAAILGAAGWRRRRAGGNPQIAVVVAGATALPLLLPLVGAFASLPSPEGGDPARIAEEAYRLRFLAGASGLILALPVCLAAGLWAGIAAFRRVRQACERARLSATAAGHALAGLEVAGSLSRSGLPWIGLGIGLLAALFAVGAPSLALVVSSLRGLENLELLAGLEGEGRLLVGLLQADASADLLRLGARIGAVGSVLAALLLGVLLHASSSRRRNLRVALEALGARAPVRAEVERALAASGTPGATGPLLLALLLLAATCLLLLHTARLREAAPGGEEAVAAFSTGRGGPPACRGSIGG